jgi:hypothetical protein
MEVGVAARLPVKLFILNEKWRFTSGLDYSNWQLIRHFGFVSRRAGRSGGSTDTGASGAVSVHTSVLTLLRSHGSSDEATQRVTE